MSSTGRDEAIVTSSHREQVPKEVCHDINEKSGVQPVMSGVYNTVTDATPSYSTQAKQVVHDVIEKTQQGLHSAKETMTEKWHRAQETQQEVWSDAANDSRERTLLGKAVDKVEEGAQKLSNRLGETKMKAQDAADETDLAVQHRTTQAKDVASDVVNAPSTTTTTTTTTTTSSVPSYTTQAKEALYNVMEKTQQGLHAIGETIQEKLHRTQEASQEVHTYVHEHAANDARDRGILGKASDKIEEGAQKVSNRLNEASTKASNTADEASLAAKHRTETVKDYSSDANSAWQQDAALHE